MMPKAEPRICLAIREERQVRVGRLSDVLRKRGMDPIGRQLALELAAGRVAVGVAAFFATRPALRGIGYPETNATGFSLAKVLGARDMTLGALTIAARDNREALRAAALAGAALDAADAVAFGFAGADRDTRRAGLGGVGVAAIAAVGGFLAWKRLGS
jgi:hypothetical protein